MSANKPEQPLRTQQLRKRYRQLRRRQLAGILLIAGLVVAVLVLLGIGVFFLRSCARQSDAALRTRIEAERGAGSLPEVAFQKTFAAAPWLIGASDGALFAAGDSQGREAGYSSNYPVDTIQAFALDAAGDTLWETASQSEYMGLTVARESVVLYNLYLLETAQVNLTGLSQQNGHQLWTLTIDGAQSPSFVVSGKVIVVAYWLADGYRLVGYNAATGVKAWGYRLGMIDEIDLSAGAPALRLAASDDRVCYSLGAGIGFVDSGSGNLIRQQQLPADISQLAIDWDNGSCLIASEPDAEGVCALYRMPLNAGIPVELHRFVPDRGIPQLVHYAGKTLLAYSGHEANQTADGCHILCFAKGATTPLNHSVMAPGVPVAAAAFPAGAHGALVSVSSELRDDGMTPQGRGSLFEVSPETGAATLHSRLGRPVVALLPFKQDLIMLYAGGGLRVFSAAVDQHLKLGDLAEAQSGWSFSPSRDTLLITGYSAAHADGRPGGRLQAVVIK